MDEVIHISRRGPISCGVHRMLSWFSSLAADLLIRHTSLDMCAGTTNGKAMRAIAYVSHTQGYICRAVGG